MDGARGASACVETKNLICSDHIIALSSPRTLRRPSAPHTRTPPPQHPPRTQMLTPRYQAPYPAPKYSWLGRSPPQFARQRAEPISRAQRQHNRHQRAIYQIRKSDNSSTHVPLPCPRSTSSPAPQMVRLHIHQPGHSSHSNRPPNRERNRTQQPPHPHLLRSGEDSRTQLDPNQAQDVGVHIRVQQAPPRVL